MLHNDEWLAGLLEGEGSFGRRKKGRMPAVVQLQMKDADVVQRAADLMDVRLLGPYTRADRPTHSPMFHAVANGVTALQVMKRIRPWMGERRGAKIDEIQTFDFEPRDHGTAWLAGLLEGEGCFFETRTGHQVHRKSLYLQLSMCDLDVLERAAAMMPGGGAVRTLKNYGRPDHWSTCYSVRRSGVRAAAIMESVLEYMGERRSQRIIELLRKHRGTA